MQHASRALYIDSDTVKLAMAAKRLGDGKPRSGAGILLRRVHKRIFAFATLRRFQTSSNELSTRRRVLSVVLTAFAETDYSDAGSCQNLDAVEPCLTWQWHRRGMSLKIPVL